MFDVALRRLVDPALIRMAGWITHTPLSANMVTISGAGLALGAAFSVTQLNFTAALVFILLNRIVDGLDGAYSLSLSVSGESVYVGSLQDRAIVLLKRQDDGLLAYVDRIKEGERLWTSFQRDIDDKPWELPSSVQTIYVNCCFS